MLKNGSFDNGHHHQDDIPEIVVPDGWSLWYLDGESFLGSEGEAMRPESVVWYKADAPPHERSEFFIDGEYCLKVFKPDAPMMFSLEQSVDGLEPGKRYKFTAHIHPDIVQEYTDDGKVYAQDPWAAEARLLVEQGDLDPMASDWFNKPSGTLEFGRYNEVSLEFSPLEDGPVTVRILCKAKWGLKNNFFIDSCSLVEMDDTPEGSSSLRTEGAKIGVHAIYAPPGVKNLPYDCMAGAKQVDIFDLLETTTTQFKVARFTQPNDACSGVENWSPERMREYAQTHLDKITAYTNERPEAKAWIWEPYNEPDPPGADGYAALAELMKITIDLAPDWMTLALFSLNAGTPEWDEMNAMVSSGVFEMMVERDHVLAVHEGNLWGSSPDEYMGEPIPGAPALEGAGPLNFRYRFLYHLLEERGIPKPRLIVTEWYNGDEESQSAEHLAEAVRRYDQEMARDWYALGFMPFTLGPTPGWEHTDYQRVYDELGPYLERVRERENARPPSGEPRDRGEPRVQYARTYVLLPPGGERLAVEARSRYLHHTIGFSADDAGIGDLDNRHVIAVNPDMWDADLETFFQEHYPGATYEEVDFSLGPTDDSGPWHADITANLAHNDSCPPPLDDGWWQRSAGEIDKVTIHHTYGALDPYTLAEGYIYKGDGRPSIPYTIWINRDGTVYLCNELEDGCWHDHTGHKNTHLSVGVAGMLNVDPPTSEQVASLVDVCVWAVEDLPGIQGVDDITGHMHWTSTECPGWLSQGSGLWREGFCRALRRALGEAPETEEYPVRGLHDISGGEWLRQNNLEGWCVVPIYLSDCKGRTVNKIAQLADSGIRVIGRLSYSYAKDDGGQGGFPPGNRLIDFEQACVDTMAQNPLAWGWVYCNELNNPREWPRDGVVTPDALTESYRRVWQRRPANTKLAPMPVDPFNAGWGDWRHAYAWGELPASFYAVHVYDHGVDADPSRTFGDAPLTGVGFNRNVLATQLAILPDKPVIITEANHGADGSKWSGESASWVDTFYTYSSKFDVEGVCLFRHGYNDDRWRFGDHKPVMERLRWLS
jgi:hypothetical protein